MKALMMPSGSLARTPQPPRLCSGFSQRPVRQIFINWLLVDVRRLQTVLNLSVTGSPRRPIPSGRRPDAGETSEVNQSGPGVFTLISEEGGGARLGFYMAKEEKLVTLAQLRL